MQMRWPRERQIEFPPEQSPHRLVTPVMIGLSLACVVVVVIILLAHPSGPFIGPWG
jgi:hypothetical protein